MDPKISVTFNIECLAQLALKEAASMPVFHGKTICSKAVFYNNEYFEGIEITEEEESCS